MASDNTYKAQTPVHLWRQDAFLPDFEAVDDVALAIAVPGEIGSARSAVLRTAADETSPVVFTNPPDRTAVSLVSRRGTDVRTLIRKWVNDHDPDVLPDALK